MMKTSQTSPLRIATVTVPGTSGLIGMTHLLLPIVDTRIPDEAWETNWQYVGPQVRMALKRGERVLIHCLGGLGRTGTLAARLLIEFGMEPEEAVCIVRKARPGAIENAIQEDYVRRQECIEMPVPRSRGIDSVRFERYRGCLIGGAVDDALGAPVEFMDLPAIQATFGSGGIRDSFQDQ
jgi:ADP-ribosyl-[dinitrogen reductase] hydrolase